jgi:hypothetical protein
VGTIDGHCIELQPSQTAADVFQLVKFRLLRSGLCVPLFASLWLLPGHGVAYAIPPDIPQCLAHGVDPLFKFEDVILLLYKKISPDRPVAS